MNNHQQEEPMHSSWKAYRTACAEYRRKNRLYSDWGYSFRPWEGPLRARILRAIRDGREGQESWAEEAAQEWGD